MKLCPNWTQRQTQTQTGTDTHLNLSLMQICQKFIQKQMVHETNLPRKIEIPIRDISI